MSSIPTNNIFLNLFFDFICFLTIKLPYLSTNIHFYLNYPGLFTQSNSMVFDREIAVTHLPTEQDKIKFGVKLQ